MVWLDIYIVGGTLHFLGHWGSHNGYIPVGATTTTTTTYIPVVLPHQRFNQRFYPIKTLYFYMERREVSLNTTIKRTPKLLGKRCSRKVLNTYGPAYATNLLFSTFFWLKKGLFLTASPVPVKMVVVVHNSANSSLGIMNRVRGRGVMMRGFFHRVRGRTGTQKSDLSMLLSTNFAILHLLSTNFVRIYMKKIINCCLCECFVSCDHVMVRGLKRYAV